MLLSPRWLPLFLVLALLRVAVGESADKAPFAGINDVGRIYLEGYVTAYQRRAVDESRRLNRELSSFSDNLDNEADGLISALKAPTEDRRAKEKILSDFRARFKRRLEGLQRAHDEIGREMSMMETNLPREISLKLGEEDGSRGVDLFREKLETMKPEAVDNLEKSKELIFEIRRKYKEIEKQAGEFNPTLIRTKSDDPLDDWNQVRVDGDDDKLFAEAKKVGRMGDLKRSLLMFEQVIGKNPFYVEAYNYAGLCHFRLKQYGSATFFIKKSLELNENDNPTARTMQKSLADLGFWP